MANVPEELRYTQDHEWVRFDADAGLATIGITDFAQGELGDVVFLELPAAGTAVEVKGSCGTIEAVKTVADLYAPVAGEIVEVNGGLEDHPERVNQDPYGEGWMIRIKVAEPGQIDGLMDAEAYRAHTG
ncbi:MAG TPA: glycine cleavage system protein GcvH [Gemmatimonadota bacterium]|nr:glycine cleavage system protein GcvH [Gemmatimonadota bacterium]